MTCSTASAVMPEWYNNKPTRSQTDPVVVTVGSETAGIDVELELDRPLTVTRSGKGAGTVTSSPAGVDCGSICSAIFLRGGEVTLTAIAASGSTFTGFSGACSCNGPCQVTMDEVRTVDARFTKNRSSISKVAVSGPGKVRVRRPAKFVVKITNNGNLSADRLRLRVTGRVIAVNNPVGRINAGVTRSVTFRIRPRKTGKVSATFRVTSSNAGSRTVRQTVVVRK